MSSFLDQGSASESAASSSDKSLTKDKQAAMSRLVDARDEHSDSASLEARETPAHSAPAAASKRVSAAESKSVSTAESKSVSTAESKSAPAAASNSVSTAASREHAKSQKSAKFLKGSKKPLPTDDAAELEERVDQDGASPS